MKQPHSLQKYQGYKLADAAADSALVKLGTLKAFAARLVTMIPSPGAGIGTRRGKDGDTWYLRGAGVVGNGVVNEDGTVTPLTIGGEMPEIGVARLDGAPAPVLGLSGTGVEYVIAEISGELNIISSVFVSSFEVESAQIVVGSTDPGPGGLVSSTGDFAVLIATFADGVKTYQRTPGDWTLKVCDDGTGTGTGVLHLVNPST